MATYVGVGTSKKADAFTAGREAVKMAYAQMRQERADLVMVLSSSRYNHQELLKAITPLDKETQLIGCTTAGEITVLGPETNSVAVMAIKSDTIKFSTGLGENISKNARLAGQLAARMAAKTKYAPRNLLIMFPDGLSGNGSDIIRGAQDVLGTSFPIVGGSAGDDFCFQKTYQFFNQQILSDSVPCLLLSGEMAFGIGLRHGWQPIGKFRTVTKSWSNLILEIDHKPAVSIYEDYFGKEADELKKEPLARMAITYPLGIKIEGESEYLIRDAISVTEEGALNCAAEVPRGSQIRIMVGSKEWALAAASSAAKGAKDNLKSSVPKAAIIFNCIARSKLLGRRSKEEIDIIREVLGADVPIIGFYTYGEQAPLSSEIRKGNSFFHNETVVILTLGD